MPVTLRSKTRTPGPKPEQPENDRDIVEWVVSLIALLQRPVWIRQAIRERWKHEHPKSPPLGEAACDKVIAKAREQFFSVVKLSKEEIKTQLGQVLGELVAMNTIARPDVAIRGVGLLMDLFELGSRAGRGVDDDRKLLTTAAARELLKDIDARHSLASPEEAKPVVIATQKGSA